MKHLIKTLACIVATLVNLEANEPSKEPSFVWKYQLNDFSEAAYQQAVEALFRAWEQTNNLKPGAKGKVGLKVYTNSGPGLATPVALVRSVIDALLKRGWQRKNIFILDLNERLLRESGFLPKLSQGGSDFDGVPVYALESEQYFDPKWYYESPLPSSELPFFPSEITSQTAAILDEDRKSFLPVPLLLEVDLWINLPVVTDHPALGISGALANATVWNISNYRRFLQNPANAPVAVAEMAAIPELKRGWAFTLLTLERYQYIGGPAFNFLYTRSEPLLLLSTNPVALDYSMYSKINEDRVENRFQPIQPEPLWLNYSQTLGLGDYKTETTRQIKLP